MEMNSLMWKKTGIFQLPTNIFSSGFFNELSMTSCMERSFGGNFQSKQVPVSVISNKKVGKIEFFRCFCIIYLSIIRKKTCYGHFL